MSIIEKFDSQLHELFTPISLNELNQKASMLTRLDNKYVVRDAVLNNLLHRFSEHFDILEIDQKRVFYYDTCYFDDAQLSCYFNHHNGRRQRIKVRTRKYIDTGLCFIEAKIKDIRGVTVKRRLPCQLDKHGQIDAQAQDYIAQLYREFYEKEFTLHLQVQLEMTYQRITLVAKNGQERMTIDTNICFFQNQKAIALSPHVFIVETKSRNANGIADAILRSAHQHPINKCSKYCLGLCITQQVARINNFMPALRKLGALESLAKRNKEILL